MSFVSHNGNHLSTSNAVLTRLGLYAGQTIGENMMWKVIAENAGDLADRIAIANMEIDTSELQALVATVRAN